MSAREKGYLRMQRVLRPIERQNLSDDLAQRVRQLIHRGGIRSGDRLPSIAEMARQFNVAHPTLREALRKLEILGVVDIRHGSGVYVGEDHNSLLIANPMFEGTVSQKLLLDLVEARISIERKTASLAADNATPEDLDHLRELLARAEENLDDGVVLAEVNLAFHRGIAVASGNEVFHQLLEVLASVIREEQRIVLETYGPREEFHREHLEILEALERKDPDLAVERIQAHLEGVKRILLSRELQESFL